MRAFFFLRAMRSEAGMTLGTISGEQAFHAETINTKRL